jgi:putative transposase
MKKEKRANSLSPEERVAIGILAKHCQNTGDLHAMLREIFAGAVEQMLEAEMEEHLGYEKHSNEGDNSGNSRNGYGDKEVTSDYGVSDIAVPRERNGTFEPQVIAKRQTRTDEIESKVVAMYSKGMTTRDIEDNLREIYGAEISASLISRITDKLLPDIMEWQNRPLESVYPAVYFDGIYFSVRQDNRVIKKCVYSVLGVAEDGRKEILGFWISENEGASFWASVCADLKKRGVKDILIACHDNLGGLDRAIENQFPACQQQLCVIHMIRASTKYVSWKDLKEVCADLKSVYCAVNLDEAEYAKEAVREKWGTKYPELIRCWDDNWTGVVTFYQFGPEIRRMIYTTNAVEGFHRMLRKFTKTRTIFPTDDAVKKAVYLSVREISRKWTMPMQNWGFIYGELMLLFGERLKQAS